MNAAVKPIQILVLHDTQNDAEPLINHFRVNGYATRSQFIASENELTANLAEHEWDLLLAKLATETVDVEHCLDTVRGLKLDLPIILLIEEYRLDTVIRGYGLGARDVILDGEPDLLVPVALRELASLENRRALELAKSQLAESEKRVQLLLKNSKDAIAYVHDGMHIYANESYMEMFEYDDLDDLLCVPVVDIVAPKYQSDLKKLLKQRDGAERQEMVCQAVDGKGELFEATMEFSAAIYDGEPCLQVVISKMEDSSAELQKQLDEISNKDLLTGLHNRQYFIHNLNAAFERVTTDQTLSLLVYILIQDISGIRAAVGVGGTDVVLTEAGSIIAGQIPETIFAARISDDAFALLVPGNDVKAIEKLSNAIVDAMADHLVEVSGKTVQLKCVIGYATLDAHLADGHEALYQANQACDMAVTQEKTVGYYDRGDLRNIADGDKVAEIKFALENARFRLNYQPIISLRGDETEHFEVLLRILSRENEQVSIGPYVSTILLSGQAAPVDRWVVLNAIEALAKRWSDNAFTRLFIHLTYTTISDPDFLPWVNTLLKKHKLPGSSLVFQISEQDATDYLKPAKAFSKGLGLLKCMFSVGNFGKVADVKTLTRHLDINFMKFDPLIVTGMATEEGHQHLKNLINDIRAEGLASIVPQIESASVMQRLWQDGANYVQGHLLQAPSDSMDFEFTEEE